MKCSLLTLSTFIDGELAPQRRAEVDAHLVGCTRCSAGAATLREERSRIGQLARVSVDPTSAQLMLEQVGIAVDSAADLSPLVPPPPAPAHEDSLPWQGGTSSAALPWTPRRPDRAPSPMPSEELGVAPEAQPDLPLEGVRAVPPSWNRAPADVPPAVMPVEDPTGARESAPAEDAEWATADEAWLDGGHDPGSWEVDLPPPADAAPPPPTTWPDTEPAAAVGAIAPPPPAAPDQPPHAPPPTRLAAASGPGALWTRIHDAVSLRLALARGGDALEDSVQIVSGAPARRGAQLPAQESQSTSGIVAAPPTPAPPAQLEPPHDQEHSGIAGSGPASEAPVHAPEPAPPVDEIVDRRLRARVEVGNRGDSAEPADTAGWNAFAASSYPELDMPAEHPVEEAGPRPLGRHSRAVAREQVPLSTRVGRATTAAMAALRAGASGATARAAQGAGRLRSSGPDNRLLAGIAGIGLIFVLALIIGHSSSRAPTPTAAKTAPATSATQPHQSAPAQSSAAASAGAPTAASVQTFGAGDTGFQVIRLRYGLQAGFSRVVFDLGAATSGAVGTPKVTVSFSSPTSLLVTLNGTVPAGSTGSPPPGKLISSVSLVSSTGNKAVYRFALTRAATTTAFYLASPTRFVLDIH